MPEEHPPTLTRRQLREMREAEERSAPSDQNRDVPSEPAVTATPDRAQKPEKTGHPVLRAVATGLISGLLILVIAVGAMAIIVPAATGSRALTVMTSSMEPALPAGTLIVVKPQDPKTLAPGDVITYQLKSGEPTLVTHRVQQKLTLADGSAALITKGDNNPKPDPNPVQEVQVQGKLWYSIPFVGWVSNAFTGDARAWIIPVVVGALFIYAAWMIFSGLREKRQKAAKETAEKA